MYRIMAVILAFVFALAPLEGLQACNADDRAQTNIMKSGLALPDDQKINMAELGGVLAVAVDDCAAVVYDANFARYLEEAKAGKVEAQDIIGLMYAHGAGTKQSWPDALSWLQKAAAQGSANASFRLGVIAQYGLAGAADLKAANDHYRKSSGLGQGFASTNLGVLYLNGLGVAADPKIAFDYFKLAAQQGDAVAYGNMGVMYMQGLGVQEDPQEAMRMFRAGASMGNPVAMRMLSFGLGRKARAEGNVAGIKEALMWAMLAAKAGDSVAQKLLDQAKTALSSDEVAAVQKQADRCKNSQFKDCN
ncbi:MAG: hypothetical protein RL481_237 [Pseudomonadota bacterium]|jgi:uncharacterized protein